MSALSFLVPFVVLAGAVVVVVFGYATVMARSVGATLRDTRFVPTTDFRMPHRLGGTAQLDIAHPLAAKTARPEVIVETLESLGFRRAGSYNVELSDHTAVFACLICPEGSTLAVVTPVHLTMQTDFAGKVLVTADRNTGAAYAPWVLHQVARRRKPESVWDLHVQALNVLGQRGQVPTVLTSDTAASVAVGIDRASLANFNLSDQRRSTMHAFVKAAKPIDTSARAQNTIDRWIAVPTRWS